MDRSKRLTLAMAILPVFLSMAAVRLAHAGDEWLPISPDDLALKDNPADPGADAMILYRESTLNATDIVGKGDSDQEYFRIKIFTQGGTKYGTVEVQFGRKEADIEDVLQYNAGLRIQGVRGRTIHPDGTIANFDGKVLTKQVAKEGETKVLVATFTLPDVQPGSIIEYKYTKQGEPEWLHSEEWTVSQDIFTREAHFTFIPPSGDTGYIPAYRVYSLPAEEFPKCDVGVNHSCVMVARNIPAVAEEALMPPRGAMESYVEWYYQEMGAPAHETPEHFWNRQGKNWNDELEHFISKQDRLKQEVSQVVGANDPDEAKLRKLYARVQQIRNLNLEAEKTEKEEKVEKLKDNSNVQDVLNHGYGYEREINFLFVGLARAAGFEATEVFLAPRSNSIFRPELEDAEQLDDDIVWVRASGKEYFLDPAARYFPFGLLPWYETDVRGLRVSKQGGDFVMTPDLEPSEATLVRHADLEVSEDGAAAGEFQVDLTGQRAALIRESDRHEDDTGRKKDLEDEIKDWLPTGASIEITKISNWDDTAQPLHVEGTVKIPGLGSPVGKRMLVPVTLFQAEQGKSFTPEKRVNPIYLHFPYEELDDVTIHVPEGYKIETLPAAQNVNRGAVSYDISASQQKDGVEVKRHLVVNGILFPQTAYPAFRAFFGFVRSNDNAQIVFQGAESAKNN